MTENRFAKYAQPASGENRFAKYAPLAQARTFERDEDEALYRQKLAAEQERRKERQAPIGLNEPGAPEDEAAQSVEAIRAREGEQKAFDKSRTPLKRLTDASTFALSAPIRMVTRGQYGLGDVAGLVSNKAKTIYNQAEGDFARANEPFLSGMKAVGDVTAGIPILSSMGAPARGLGATASVAASRLANRPYSALAAPRAAVRDARLDDLEAFRASKVDVFPPALTEAGTAGAVKQMSETPIVGQPVRKALEKAVTQTRDAGERVAGQYGDAKTLADVGNVAKGGLERFKDAKAADLGEEAAKALSDTELTKISAQPVRETSIKTKQDALYERAWRGIPQAMRKGRSVKETDRVFGGMTNTQAVLKDITGRNQRMFMQRGGEDAPSAELGYPVRGGIAGQIVKDIVEGKWRGNLQSMRDVRSSFRRLASGMSDTEKNVLQNSDFRRLQSAMTQDMISLLERNAAHYSKAKGGKKVAAAITRAIHDFKRADQFTRASVGRLEQLEKLYGTQSAEQLSMGIIKDAMGGRKGGNIARLTALRRSLKNDEWDDISGGLIRELGRPIASARGIAEDAGFSVQSAVTRWNEMSDHAKDVLFNRPGEGKALRNSLDKFMRVADRMANFESLVNNSKTATNAIGLGGLISTMVAAQQAAMGSFKMAAGTAAAAGGTYAFGKFMTSPLYVRWLTRAAELSGSPDKLTSLRTHARLLANLARKEPDLPVQEMMTATALGLDQQINARIQAQGTKSPLRQLR